MGFFDFVKNIFGLGATPSTESNQKESTSSPSSSPTPTPSPPKPQTSHFHNILKTMKSFLAHKFLPFFKSSKKRLTQYIEDHAIPLIRSVRSWIKKRHPDWTTAALIAFFVLPLIVGAALGPILAGLGWTAAGVGGFSFAAFVHSTIGNVVAGSLFAFLQSITASGVVACISAVCGAILGIGMLGLFFVWLFGRKVGSRFEEISKVKFE